jgi:hypothetical protein
MTALSISRDSRGCMWLETIIELWTPARRPKLLRMIVPSFETHFAEMQQLGGK